MRIASAVRGRRPACACGRRRRRNGAGVHRGQGSCRVSASIAAWCGTDWTRVVTVVTTQEGSKACCVTVCLSDSDKAVLMGGIAHASLQLGTVARGSGAGWGRRGPWCSGEGAGMPRTR